MTAPHLQGLRQVAQRAVQSSAPQLTSLSHRVHATPEIGFEEVRSSAAVADVLSEFGFEVTAGVCELPTAFEATVGSGELVIAICAEYDALPGIGHACGHNIIAAAAVGAGLALAPLADELDLTVKVLGTPAEEGGGGKVLMLERGAFTGVHAAMMVHPAPYESLEFPCLAVSQLHVHYTGRAAHAAAFPQLGLNAADALTVAQVAVGLLRQHISPRDRVHGIVTKGGDAPNVIPADTSAKYYVRSPTRASLVGLEQRVRACFDAGALATGCEVKVEPAGPTYSEFKPDAGLLAAYEACAGDMGREFPDLGALADTIAGSTDMANVSLEIPTIHPMVAIDSKGAVNHQPEFAAACITESADSAVVEGAIAMAWTAIEAATNPDLRRRLVDS